MAPRRGASSNSLSPPEVVFPGSGSTSPGTSPRSVSPSNGLTQFLSRPTKWFNRSTSDKASRSSMGPNEPRSSTSSSGRKHKISHPTDPRPFIENLVASPERRGLTSKSVLDLSRTATAFDDLPKPPRMPSSPTQPSMSRGLGDLRNISRKPWSKSADDLSKLSSHMPAPVLTPLDTTFHGRIEQYRNNRGGSVGSMSTVPSPSVSSIMSGQQKNYPFPAITTSPSEPLSASPPSRPSIQLSAASPTLTGGTALTPSLSNSSTHVHTRSHSFTPRLPSKLASPKGALQPPLSPKRKGSGSSIAERTPERDREKNISGGSGGHGPSSRSPFPFILGGGRSPANPSSPTDTPSSPTSLAPPTIVEPPPDTFTSKMEKRSSQLIYHSGFINRLVDFSPSALNVRATHTYMSGSSAPTLSKGWKPYKLVLKGSKLYFFKPPSDRSAAIKELFPTELVTVLEDEGLGDGEFDGGDAEEEVARGGRARDRKRAYWGRGTHPSLVVVDGKVERGAFEALVHEAVFATTFVRDPNSAPDGGPAEATPADEAQLARDQEISQGGGAPESSSRYDLAWRDFASNILFSLPFAAGRSKFETELMRCCAYLLSGVEDVMKEEEASRVRWLAGQYLAYHGAPVDRNAWEEWRKETIPDFPSDPSSASKLAGLPKSSSMQALYTASPQVGSSSPADSPDLGAFSPRPDTNSKMMSIVDALGVLPPSNRPSISGPSSPPRNSSRDALVATLERDGFTRDALVGLDSQLLARSLSVFNHSLLAHVPDNFTADLCLSSESAETEAAADPNTSSTSSPLTPFLSTDDQPHWLTRMILIQTLVPEPAGTTSPPIGYPLIASEERHVPTSRTHTRSEVISAWAKIGELCRRTGDECSWRAIFAALCSRPVARLEKVWKRVDPEAVAIVQSWAQPQKDGTALNPGPVRVPWAGDVRNQIQSALERARYGAADEWQLMSLGEARQRFEALRTAFALCARPNQLDETAESSDVEILVKVWRYPWEGKSGHGVASKFTRIEQFMSLSMAAEPRRKGLFEPYYWTRSASQQSTPSLAGALFPEPLPSVSLINRALLMRGRLESSASLNMQDIQHLRQLPLRTSRDSPTNRRATAANELGGTILSVFDGELLLLVPSADSSAPSRPTSRTPSRPPSSVADSPVSGGTVSRTSSIRVSPGVSHGLDRKPSMIKRNSLPSISQRTSLLMPEASPDKALRVVVQAGTLDRLVDVLVHGLQGVSVSVSDDNGEMPLTAAKTREVKLDMDDFSDVWWNVYRSFMTPQILFEFLRKRYNSARLLQSSSIGEVNDAVRMRSEVLETMNEWINRGGGAQDILDDAQLHNAFFSFLDSRAEHEVPQLAEECRQHVSVLDQLVETLRMTFFSQTLRPTRSDTLSDGAASAVGAHNFGSDIPNIDELNAEQLVDNLDAMTSAALRNVNQEDLFVTADILEVQSADRTGWFLPRDPSSLIDEVEIQAMNSYITEVEPSTLISELGQDSLYRLLPPSVRGCIRASNILRKWLVCQLISPRLGLRARQARMEKLLRAIEISRLRSTTDETNPERPMGERPCIRSAVEAILTSAAVSVESRTHYRAWQNIALGRGTYCDSLASFLSRPAAPITSRGALAVDIGWVLEKMLEVISTPDVLESMSETSSGMVNFDKRRSLKTLISSSTGATSRKRRQRRHVDRRDFERLNNIERQMSSAHFDIRGIREEAHREATQSGPLGAKKIHRPFQALVALQQEKNKRDRHLRDRLSKEKRHEQHLYEQKEESISRAMQPRRQPVVSQKQHRNKKSMSSAFFQFMRPISSAFSSDTLSTTLTKRTPAELDFTPTNKPSLVLSVVDARVVQFVNNERSFTFQLDTEDGGQYLLQAVGRPEMKKWMDTVQHVSAIAAKRRLTYLGQNAKLQLSDHLLSQPVAPSRDPRAFFGVDLEVILKRESPEGDIQLGAIPSILERLISEVESRGLTEVGIYRIAGSHAEVNAYKDALNRGEWPITSSTDIYAVCDLIKSWFRVLPGGLFSSAAYEDILRTVTLDGADLDTKVSGIRRVVHGLSDMHFDLLKRIIEHLDKVTDFEENNQMTAESLATVFGPNILRSPTDDIAGFLANMGPCNRAMRLLISHSHSIFDDTLEQDAEVEYEREQEDFEFDEPIPEEDEDEELLCDPDMDADPEGPETPEDEKDVTEVAVTAGPPVLDLDLGSPHSLSFSMAS
ncbi:uncharacterized protein B0H18DRAFT_1118293 [Fomitopsis serialis]|uniref:uncharacterized protein n=1 Tax=Fomitopsis serialis TaxID=139415 RepID=UPI0020084136|nr:uncharacterized protein B0H18DRAFT_1118293 [Neoantrodia serialis]KAH9927766.1 hypothetical protein B0H18DRAFT_1118293 [Neoantrodia serialis]